MGINEIKAEALKLRPEVRAYLVRELLASLEGLDEAEVERLWLEEATRRDEDLGRGKARALPARETLKQVRDRRR